jgi:hypothetical protein
VEVLYFQGCPSYLRVWQDLAEAITKLRLDACVCLIHVDTPEKADALDFAGSPTVKVNGRDLEGYEGQGVMACRVYQENEGKGWPSQTLLVRTLTRYQEGELQ